MRQQMQQRILPEPLRKRFAQIEIQVVADRVQNFEQRVSVGIGNGGFRASQRTG